MCSQWCSLSVACSLKVLQELTKSSPVPVVNALSSLWHPTQVLADLLTLQENAHLFDPTVPPLPSDPSRFARAKTFYSLPPLRPLTVAYVGDSANVLHDMLAAYLRLGHSIRVATTPAYRVPESSWAGIHELGISVDPSVSYQPCANQSKQ